MAVYVLNEDYSDSREVEAATFSEQGSFVIFYSSDNEQVYAVPTRDVKSISRKDS